MDDKLTIFIAVTSAAVVLQMLILAGMYFTLRTLSTHLKTTADEFKAQAFPLLENGKAIQADIKRILETSAPKVELVLDNAAAITTTAHAGIERVESTMNDILDRARLQVIRADEMVTRAMDYGGRYDGKSCPLGDLTGEACQRTGAGDQRGTGHVFRAETETRRRSGGRDVYLARL